MTPADLSRVVVRAVRCAVEDGELPAGVVVPERVVVERSRPGGVGDYASPVAFRVGKDADVPPRDVAEMLAGRLGGVPGIERVEITGAGFLNFVLVENPVAELVRGIRARGTRYGFAPDGEPRDRYGFAPDGELRDRVVRGAVLRILHSQGQGQGYSQGHGHGHGNGNGHGNGHGHGRGPSGVVAPVARRDGDVVAVFGCDAAAWAMLGVPAHETPVFPAWLPVQDESSEFFRVRYAYSRACALSRNAEQLGFHGEASELGDLAEAGDPAEACGLGERREPVAPREATATATATSTATATATSTATATATSTSTSTSTSTAPPLLRALADYPLVLEAAAHHRAPERLVRHLVVLADALLDFQYAVPVLPKGDEKPSAAHRARLALTEAAGTVLAGGLALLGIDAPDRL